MDVILCRNPACGIPHHRLATIRTAAIEPHLIEYRASLPSRASPRQRIARMGTAPRDLPRRKRRPIADLRLDDPGLTETALIDAAMTSSILIDAPSWSGRKACGRAARTGQA